MTLVWRRGWDSNPRYACTHNGFRDRPDRPLRHLSVAGAYTDVPGPPQRPTPGRHPGGASSNPLNLNAGATTQLTSVHAPRLSADCQHSAGTTACGPTPPCDPTPTGGAPAEN